MIDEYNTSRIRNDAYIACDALQSLMYASTLHENYIKEKLDVVRRCIKFIEHFESANTTSIAKPPFNFIGEESI